MTKADITVLRLGHRTERDKRVSTHVGLTARALGAKRIVYSGQDDPGLVTRVNAVNHEWGGHFVARYEKNWLNYLKKFRGLKVHLTFFGEPLQQEITAIRKNKKILVIVGAEKVPRDVYALSDLNVAVTNQPHSEIAALAVFLHDYFEGKELAAAFSGARKHIRPAARGKNFSKNTSPARK